MTTENLIPDLERDEGLRLDAYPDPLSGGDPWTIGYGHTGAEVHSGVVWTQAQAAAALEDDKDDACGDLDAQLPWWRNLDDVRQDVLANMTFNLGIGHPPRDGKPGTGLQGFPKMLAATQAGDWQSAHDEMLDSDWAKQTGQRAVRLANQMLTGVHQA